MNLGQLPKPSSIELSSAQLRSVLGPIVRSGLAGTLQHPQPGRWHQSALQGTRARAGFAPCAGAAWCGFQRPRREAVFSWGEKGAVVGACGFLRAGVCFLAEKTVEIC